MASGNRQWNGVTTRVWAVLLLCWLALPWHAAAAAPQPIRHYLLLGEATTEPTPHRVCTPAMLGGQRQDLEVPAPARGWSGQPQALDVFNVFAGEVLLRHGDREICGNMGDARTRDSRFRAGVGIVFVPPAGSHEPVHVSWAMPLKERWGPTLRLGAPSPVQQNDTARLLARAACLAITLALALSALMGWLNVRDRLFLAYVGICVVFVMWQSVLGGLSGYPEPWFGTGLDSAWGLVGLTALTQSLLLPVVWRLSAGERLWPTSMRWIMPVSAALLVAAMFVPTMSWRLLGWLADVMEAAHITACALTLLVGIVAWTRGDRLAAIGVAATLPFVIMIGAELMRAWWVLAYRVELLQLAVTWLLMMAGYALNLRLGNLREQRDQMRHLADTDALTGLPNRRAGLRQLALQMEQAQEAERPLVIGFLDIDLFKDINDRHGHEAGDAVLVAVAGALRGAVRTQDEVFRMGGEEFLLVLPGSTREQAARRLERVREGITAACAALDVAGLHVTASIGLAQWRPRQDDVAALLRRADHAMYGAKRAGRNRVMDGEEADSLVTG